MTPAEICTWLRSTARRCEDAAQAGEAATESHRPEYEVVLAASPAPDMHARALELYEHVVGNEREARRLRAEAEVLREAAGLIGIDNWQPIATAPKDKDILVWCSIGPQIVAATPNGGWFNGDIELNDDVGGLPTHWMSLPKGPEEES